MIDPWTVGASVASSLVASYVGVRYFTGPRIRAERAQAARLSVRDFVSPLQRDVREFRAHMKQNLARDNAAHPDDAVTAIRLLRLAHDLPPLSRRRVRHRLDLIFGSGWMRIARLRDSTVQDEESTSASYAMAISLFDTRAGLERRSYVDGLLHRAYVAGPDSHEVRSLERQLLLLSECR